MALVTNNFSLHFYIRCIDRIWWNVTHPFGYQPQRIFDSELDVMCRSISTLCGSYGASWLAVCVLGKG